MARHANSALLAVACDDLSIRMFDVEVLPAISEFTHMLPRHSALMMSACLYDILLVMGLCYNCNSVALIHLSPGNAGHDASAAV